MAFFTIFLLSSEMDRRAEMRFITKLDHVNFEFTLEYPKNLLERTQRENEYNLIPFFTIA